MQTIFAVENEHFKLQFKSEDNTLSNFSPRTRKIELNVCKNSFAAFQVVILSDEDTCVNVGEDPWFSELGDMNVLRLAHEGDLPATMQHIDMHRDDSPIYYADALLNHKVINAEKNVPISIYIKIEIPKELDAGTYNGKVRLYTSRLFENENYIGEVQYTLDVCDVVLPDAGKGSFYLDLWQHNSNLARKAETVLWSDRHFEIIEQYVATLAALGQCAVTVVVSEIPWCGQRCFLDKETPSNMFEYSMIRVKRLADGSFVYDYSALDRYIRLCFSYGIDKEIEIFGLVNVWVSVNDGYFNFTNYPEAIRIRYLDADNTYKYMRKARDIEHYVRSLHDHFVEQGWIDKVRVTADEPWELEPFKQSLDLIRRIAPGFRYKAAIGDISFYRDYQQYICDFVPSVICLCREYDEFSELIKKDVEHRFLWYVACSPEYPNTHLRSNLLEIRYIAILTDFFHCAGFLRWNYTAWPKNPREDIRFSIFPAGDTNFVYPAGDMSPLLSLRYMALRRGIEDYELIQMAKAAGRDDIVQEIYRIVIKNKNFKDFFEKNKSKQKFENMSTVKYNDYQKIRELLYGALKNKTEKEIAV